MTPRIAESPGLSALRGLDTAATLWCAGTVAIIAVDVGPRELGRAVDREED